MNIVTRIVKTPYASYRAGWPVYHLKERLVSAGWTVAGSSNGTTGGMDGVDRITSGASFATASTSWLVLQSPHATASDRVQIEFRLTATTNNSGVLEVSYDPSAALASSTTADPTSATKLALQAVTMWAATDANVTILADRDPPYGWALLMSNCTNVLDGVTSSIVFCPLDTRGPVSPGKPYVVIYSAGGASTSNYTTYASLLGLTITLGAYTTSNLNTRVVAEPRNPPKQPILTYPLLMKDHLGTVLPVGMTPDSSDAVTTCPIIFQNSTEYIGSTSFMRWMGAYRTRLTVFGDSVGPRRWIVFDDVCFPWDGTTLPISNLSDYNVPL